MLDIGPSPSRAATPNAPPSIAATRMNAVSHLRIVVRTILSEFCRCQALFDKRRRLLSIAPRTLRHAVHRHIHLARANAQKKLPGNGIVAIEAIQNGRLRIERDLASNAQRDLLWV